jgi:uncharacterized protein YyaL (SSP411 family)
LFAATYGLAAVLHARHALQVVVTGRADDPQAQRLEDAAAGVFRFGKAVLRVTPERLATNSLPASLQNTLPHLRATEAQALVCVETSCQPPTRDPEKLAAMLQETPASATAS